MSAESVCLSCGACCASFRVSFYWAEADASQAHAVPEHLTEKLNTHRSCMRGTNSDKPRCTALNGEVGEAVSCGIYNNRPSPCREFPVSWEHGEHNDACDRARLRWGLPILNPDDLGNDEDRTPPKAA